MFQSQQSITGRPSRHSVSRIPGILAAAVLSTATLSATAQSGPLTKLRQTEWRQASSMIAVSEHGGIVVVPNGAIAQLNDGYAQLLHSNGNSNQVALPPADPVALQANGLFLQVTTDPVTTLPVGAVVSGIEIDMALGADEVLPDGRITSRRSGGFTVIDDEFTLSDTGAAAQSGNRAKKRMITSSMGGPYLPETYGHTSDLWDTPAMPTVGAHYRGNSLVIMITLRNTGQHKALVAIDHFRYRLHYRMLSLSAKHSISDVPMVDICGTPERSTECDPSQLLACYAGAGADKTRCDRETERTITGKCAADPRQCVDKAAHLLEWTRSGASVDAFYRLQSASTTLKSGDEEQEVFCDPDVSFTEGDPCQY